MIFFMNNKYILKINSSIWIKACRKYIVFEYIQTFLFLRSSTNRYYCFVPFFVTFVLDNLWENTFKHESNIIIHKSLIYKGKIFTNHTYVTTKIKFSRVFLRNDISQISFKKFLMIKVEECNYWIIHMTQNCMFS